METVNIRWTIDLPMEVPDDWGMNQLPDMLDDCINAIRKDFGE